jgi:drug/metabolite transporter (DMT)-like permease
MVPVNNATILNFFIPMVMSILAVILLKERLSYTLIFSILICFFTIIYFYKPQAIWSLGYLLLIVDVFSYSLSMVLSKKLMIKKQSPVAILFFKVIVVSITSLHCLPSLSAKIAAQPMLVLPNLLVGISYLCENLLFFTAYMLVAVSKLQPLYYTRIVFAVVISYLILNEQLSYTQVIVASVIILVNINLIRVERKKKKSNIENN